MTFRLAINVASSRSQSSIDLSASESTPTCLSSWISTTVVVDGNQAQNNQRIERAAIGCRDGSVFLLRSSLEKAKNSIPHLGLVLPADLDEPLPRPSSPLRYPGLGRRSVRSASPSSIVSNFSPLQIAKPRVISALSPEQAEAPTSYVDFEDEPEKLKGMLRGRGPKDKSVVEASMSSKEMAFLSDNVGANLPGKPFPNQTSPLIVTPASDESSPRSSFSSSSAVLRVRPAEVTGTLRLSLVSHVIPPTCTPNASVVSMRAIQHGRLLVCLRQDG